MKFKTTIIISLIIFIIITLNSVCFSKYIFTYTQNAIELNIDRTPPILQVEYADKEPSNKGIEVKIKANEQIQEVEGWALQEDKKTLIKKYEQNINETIIIKDLSENKSEANILITNIDYNSPNAEIIEKTNTNIGYERYANKTHDIKLKLKVSDDNKIINKLEEFKILVGDIQVIPKEVKIFEKNEKNIIYELSLENITENGKLIIKIPENSFEDIVGNKMNEKILDTEIEIDNIYPIIEYSSHKETDGKILVQIKGNEKIRNIQGWEIDKTHQINSKRFISDITYQREVKDFAGNIAYVDVKIENSEYLQLETIAHISEEGWVNEKNNFFGITKLNNKYKIEALRFKIGDNVPKDFLQVSGFVYNHWGENSYAKDVENNYIYNYGYNPLNGYKNMSNSDLVEMNGKKYIQLSGTGINGVGTTDINGNNPIPSKKPITYEYGISGLKLDLKSHKEQSIIYKIYTNESGWLPTCKNGEEAMYAKNKPIQAIKIAVVPSSEVETIINQWDKN